MDIPQIGDYVTAAAQYATGPSPLSLFGSFVVVADVTGLIWRVVAINDLHICLSPAKKGDGERAVLVRIGEYQFSPAPVDMVRAMCGANAAGRVQDWRDCQADLSQQLEEVLGRLTGGKDGDSPDR